MTDTITSRIDQITHIAPEYLGEVLPAPKSVKIERTSRCNFNCAFCATGKGLRDKGNMSQEFYERIVREMREAGVEELGMFYLGEPFLDPLLAQSIRFAKEEVGFPYVFCTTNGSVAFPQKLQQCFQAGLDSLKFSLNYATEEQFVDIARVKPKLFHQMIQNIHAARTVRDAVEEETGHRCKLYASYISYDDEQGERMKELVDVLSDVLDEIYELPLYNQADLVTDEERARGWTPSPGNRGRKGNMVNPLPCWAVFTEGHITYDGLLAACCFSHTDAFTMADLNRVSFMEGWNSILFQELRRAHLKRDVRGTPCEDCMSRH